MKKYILLLVFLPFIAHAVEMVMPIRGLADGDTIKTVLPLQCPLCNVSIRILGIDTPEKGKMAKCSKEAELAVQARKTLENLIAKQETMVIKNFKWDKYGGRIDANVEVNGVDIGKSMIEKGVAKPYTGSGPKPNWCTK